MPRELRPLPTSSKVKLVAQHAPSEDKVAANTAARALGCRVIERFWPAWSKADTIEMLVRWTLIVQDRREIVGRPLRRDLGAQRSDWADCERKLRVPLAHLLYNARIHRLPMPVTVAAADVPLPSA